MNQKFYSMKEIAAELGTSKQRVYRCIKKHCIKETHSEVVNGNTVLMYDNAAFLRISELLSDSGSSTSNEAHKPHQKAHRETVNETLYEALLKQLEAKDQQIEKLQQALDQAQKLHALDKQKILELEDKTKVAVEPEQKKSWFKKMFT